MLDPKHAAARLGICTTTIWRMIRDGRLKAVKIGRRYRIEIAELERFIAGREG